jgi:MerR family transcriptional regulator, copper efflux regulator
LLDLHVGLKVYDARMRTDYRIAEVASLAGVSAATLRYYEQIGLLPAPLRTSSGYRMYDDSAVDRLAFISRAKQLGCSLEEIADLTLAWDGGECGPIQDRLRGLVASKLEEATAEISSLGLLRNELRAAAEALERHRPVGACDDSCGCLPDVVAESTTTPVTFGRTRSDIPVACTLGPGDIQQRISDWRHLLVGTRARTSLDGGVHLAFAATVDVQELTRLVVAEQDCCRFFAFAITVDDRGVGLDIRGPLEALEPIFGVVS